MSKRVSKLQRAKNLVKQGYSNKYIFENYPKISRQTVYNARWMLNKEKGLASLPKPEPVASGTGITSSAIPLEFEIIDRPENKKSVKASNNRRKAQLKRWARERQLKDAASLASTPSGFIARGLSIREVPPSPTLWQKIKSFFVGA